MKFGRLTGIGAGLRVDLLGAPEVGVVGEGRVDDRAGDELDAALDVEAVVVPPHRVEDLLAAHALVAGDEVGVGVADSTCPVCSEPLTVGGGVSMEKTSARVFVRSKR